MLAFHGSFQTLFKISNFSVFVCNTYHLLLHCMIYLFHLLSVASHMVYGLSRQSFWAFFSSIFLEDAYIVGTIIQHSSYVLIK